MFVTRNACFAVLLIVLQVQVLNAARFDEVEDVVEKHSIPAELDLPMMTLCRCSKTTFACADASFSQWLSMQWQKVKPEFCDDSFRDAREQLANTLDSTMIGEGADVESAVSQLKVAASVMKNAMVSAALWSVEASLDGKSESVQELIKGRIEKQLAKAGAAIDKGTEYILAQRETSIATKELEVAIAASSISRLEAALENANAKDVDWSLIVQGQRRQDELEVQRKKLKELSPKINEGKNDLASVQRTIKQMADQMAEIDEIQNDLGPDVKEAMEMDGSGWADNALHEKLASSGEMIRNPTEELLDKVEIGVRTALTKME